jgi:uncharacterized tellurite resistance protein B-like protein
MVDNSTRRKFETLVSAAFADGLLADEEKEVLQQKAKAWGISYREMQDMIALGQQRKLSVSVPSTEAEREALLSDLIDVVTADGRVEAPEYHVLARFAQTLNLGLPELRMRVNRRLQGKSETRMEPRRETVRSSPVTWEPRRPAPAPAPPPPPFPAAPAPDQAPAVAPRGPIRIDSVFPQDPKVADLPPVTLQLLKQSMSFDTEADSLIYIGRILGLNPDAARQVREEILDAFPDLKPGGSQLRVPRR